MEVEAVGSSETSPLYNILYDVLFQQTVAAVMRFAISENRNAGKARNGTKILQLTLKR
jgi:hypothetical protein